MGYTLILFVERVAITPDDAFHEHGQCSNDQFNTVRENEAAAEVEFLRSSINDDTSELGKAAKHANDASAARPFILLAALSIHSVFEGIAIGLQDTLTGTI